MRKTKVFINLTNGIEAIPMLRSPHHLTYRFIRIQSTQCEQKHWDQLLRDLDYEFLMSLALGYNCIVYDYSQRKECPRACWQGIPFIIYVLQRRWFGKKGPVWIREMNVEPYFEQVYYGLNKKTKKKLDYFKKFLICEDIRLQYKGKRTRLDGQYEEFKRILKTFGTGIA